MLDLICILDRSGSMNGSEKHVIDSFNEFIAKQRDSGDKAKVTLVLFDDQYEKVYERVKIEDVPELTAETYFVRGMTAMNDAIGKTLATFKDKKKVFVFVETDGYENASKEYTGEAVRALVQEKKDKGWEFMFVGADLSQEQTANMGTAFGIQQNVSFSKSATGYATRNASINSTLDAYKAGTTDGKS